MKNPTLLGTILLAHILVVLPLLVWRSARQLRAARAAAPGSESVLPVPRTQVYISTLFMLGILFLLTWLAARDSSYDIFRIGSIGAREILAGVAAFLLYLVLRKVARALRTEKERRRTVVRAMLPRSPREWALYLVMAIAAGIAEEAAYRGVGMSLLREALGNPCVAVLILATAFALAHLIQEWKSVPIIFLMALVMHGLVAITGTLVIAMVVHAVFDVVAGVLATRETSFTQEAG